MTAQAISEIVPFEIHLTVGELTLSQQSSFVEFCRNNDARPLLIELAQGVHMQQPMLSKVVRTHDFNNTLKVINQLSSSLSVNGFKVHRAKVEVPHRFAVLFKTQPAFVSGYFEWHGKIDYKNADRLKIICEKHKAHLSSNSLKNQNTRFVTVREFGAQQVFESRVELLKSGLIHGDWLIIKQESEYCIYDSNNLLDQGWLPE